jgi:threonine dehydrogenase-like Zn-dependent dehydrogenase
MKAVICQNEEMRVEDVPDPNPGSGQVKLSVVRCGICGSDLHARHGGLDAWAELGDLAGYHRLARGADPVVFGHEFSGEVAEYGTKTKRKLPTGTPVVALPLLRNDTHVDGIGLSTGAPGAYAEHLNVEESLMFAVPNGLPPDVAALTEPMAVAHHAVQRGEVKKKQVAIVIGCGPVGLGVILMLKARGVQTVVASDFSAGRRTLAKQCGADIVVDPKTESPYTAAPQTKDHLNDIPQTLELAVSTVEKLGKLPIDWSHLWRAADKVGAATPKHPVVFECVGVPGMIESVIEQTPLFSRVVVVGVCVGADKFQPALAINKEVDLRFVIGYTPLEFRDTLHMLADGKVDPRPLITGEVGLNGVDAAFTALGDPETHAKILVDPKSSATAPHVGDK